MSNASNTPSLARHRWYYFKEGFSPSLVNHAIQDTKLRKGDTLIDPFNGSGTVTLTAAQAGISSLGIEVNPFASFLGATKLSRTSPEVFSKERQGILAGVKRGATSFLENTSTFSRESSNTGRWLFNKEILRAFEGGWRKASRLNKTTRDLYYLALIGSAMDTCNATRDGKCLRYRKNWDTDKLREDDFLESLEKRMDIIQEDLAQSRILTPGVIKTGDVRRVLDRTNNRFRLCVTSPPYLNSFDYSDIYRPELFLGHFIKTNQELRKLRMSTVRSHVQVAWKDPSESNFGALYERTIKEIELHSEELWSKRIPFMIQAYFEDMGKVLKRLKQLALPRASLWLVVSTSAYAGIEVPVDLILADVGVKSGWYLREVAVLRYLRSSSQRSKVSGENNKLRESVIIFDTNPVRKII